MITLQVSAESCRVTGFSHLWAKYVIGFDSSVHCIQCLIGIRSSIVTRTMASAGEPLAMDESGRYDYLYICGVTRNWSTNFHLVLRPKPGSTVTMPTYNGIDFLAENAESVAIPWLDDGFRGLPKSFTTCRNFQFGVAAYGLPASSSDAA